MKRFVLAVLGAALLLGCGNVDVQRLNKSYVPERPPDCPLREFRTEAEVKEPFEDLCYIVSERFGLRSPNPTSETYSREKANFDSARRKALKEAKQAACRCGGDSFIWVSRDEDLEVKIRAIRLKAQAANSPAQ